MNRVLDALAAALDKDPPPRNGALPGRPANTYARGKIRPTVFHTGSLLAYPIPDPSEDPRGQSRQVLRRAAILTAKGEWFRHKDGSLRHVKA